MARKNRIEKCDEEKSRSGDPFTESPAGEKGHGCFSEARLGAAYGFLFRQKGMD